ncbi:hypothetical protein D3C86_1777930 [compost metagenome]
MFASLVVFPTTVKSISMAGSFSKTFSISAVRVLVACRLEPTGVSILIPNSPASLAGKKVFGMKATVAIEAIKITRAPAKIVFG